MMLDKIVFYDSSAPEPAHFILSIDRETSLANKTHDFVLQTNSRLELVTSFFGVTDEHLPVVRPPLLTRGVWHHVVASVDATTKVLPPNTWTLSCAEKCFAIVVG